LFVGGELWTGMKEEIGQYENLAWIKRLGLTKGTLKTHIIVFCSSV